MPLLEGRYLSSADPSTLKEALDNIGYFNNSLVDTEYAAMVDVTPSWLSQEIVASKAMLERVNKAARFDA